MTAMPLSLPFDARWQQILPDIKVAALDLDDTLLNPDKQISPGTLQALEAWLAAGRHIVVATGRPPRLAKTIPACLQIHPLICYNGAWIEYRDKLLYKNQIPAADTHRFLNSLLLHFPDMWVGIESDDVMYEPYARRPDRESVICDMRDLRRPAAKILFVPSSMTPAQYTMIRHLAPAGTTWQKSVQYDLLQIMGPNTDKAAALAWWLQTQGLSLDQAVAVGDDTNDLGMVAAARLGVAMQNAVGSVQEAADFITASNREDGVAKVLESVLAAVDAPVP